MCVFLYIRTLRFLRYFSLTGIWICYTNTELTMQTSTSAPASSKRKKADRMQDVHCTMGGPNGVIMDLVRSFSASRFLSSPPKPSPPSALVSLICSAPPSPVPRRLIEFQHFSQPFVMKAFCHKIAQVQVKV